MATLYPVDPFPQMVPARRHLDLPFLDLERIYHYSIIVSSEHRLEFASFPLVLPFFEHLVVCCLTLGLLAVAFLSREAVDLLGEEPM